MSKSLYNINLTKCQKEEKNMSTRSEALPTYHLYQKLVLHTPDYSKELTVLSSECQLLSHLMRRINKPNKLMVCSFLQSP